ncbi:MAG: hypothetical protein ACFFBE_12570 [Promethearchaeota archaeon]
MSNKQYSKEDIINMLKCVRCGSIKDLKPYAHSTSMVTGHKRIGKTHTTEYISWAQEFPICAFCFGYFKKRGRFLTITLILWFISLCFFIYGGLMTFFTPSYMYLPIIGGIICTISIFTLMPYIALPNPKKYMNVLLGIPKVKPESFTDWVSFSSWAEMVLKERILEGTIDPSHLIKNVVVEIPKLREEQQNRELVKKIEKNLKFCSKCGNMVDLSRKQTCDVCGTTFSFENS